jgi:site-specific DNA-methyltransferase (adenine-specific)
VPSLDTNRLYCDDNIDRVADMPSESVDLVYLDPPFFSNRVYEVIWGDEAEVRSFEDRWEGDIEHYVGWMKQRVVELHRVLKPTGSLYLHCDPHASHYLKVMLDSVFRRSNFRNEIVWRRTLAKSSPMAQLPANHDLILNYVRSPKAPWKEVRVPYDLDNLDSKTASKYVYSDPDGRKYRLDNLLHPEQGRRANLDYEVMGVRRTWRWSKDRMEKAIADGLVVQTKPGRVPQQKRYLDEQKGRMVDDVWIDINPLNSQARERLGYPTQKPSSLLRRIIESSTEKGDVLLDPFCGCGTSVAVAYEMDRQWIGIDISVTAMNVMKDRFWIEHRHVPVIENMPDTVERLKQLHHFEFQNWVIKNINGSHSPRNTHDMGIDGYWWFTREPVQVKQSEHVGRNVVDNFETAIRRDGQDSGYVIAFSFTKGAREETARAKKDGLNIRLITVNEVLLMKRRAALSGDFGPQPAEGEVVPFEARKPDELPSAEELIANVRQATTA